VTDQPERFGELGHGEARIESDRPRRWTSDLVGLAWVVLAATAVLIPALRHGASLGPFDALSSFGLSHQAGVTVHNTQSGDQVTELIPWAGLNWMQVHHGHLPLWNPYSALGLPQAFNWQSATFSVPSLVSYLAPLRLSFTVSILTTVIIAGTGAYFLGRVMGLGVPACAFAGTVFEIGGAFFSLLGWPITSVMSWGGWILAGVILVLRRRHRLRSIAFLSVVIACSIYSGQPDALVVLGAAVALFTVVMLVLSSTRLGGPRSILRPAFDTLLAAISGAALAAPIALPGLQLTGGSIRSNRAAYQALPFRDLAHAITQGYDGLPVAGSQWPGVDYLNSSLYVGVIVLVLALVAVALRWRRPEVTALSILVLGMGVVVFVPVVASVIGDLPVIKHIAWNFALIPLSLGLAVLAAVGLDVLIRSWREHAVRAWMLVGCLASGLLLATLWIIGRGGLPHRQLSQRSHSLIWPVVETLSGLVVVGLLTLIARRRHSDSPGRARFGAGWWAGASLLCVETAFLVVSGAQLWSSSEQYFASTPSMVELKAAVGSSVVGFGSPSCFVPPTLGILQEANIAYGVHEFSAYDPMTPEKYFTSWFAITGTTASAYVPPSAFCPAVTSVSAARLFGIGYVLEPARAAGPVGSTLVKSIDSETLYKIPDAARATLTPLSSSRSLPPAQAEGTPVNVDNQNPALWKLSVSGQRAQVLRLRLTDVPGWHATIDGRPLALQRFSGIMLQAVVPPGRHEVEIAYWPDSFSVGIVLAGCCLLGFTVAFAIVGWRRRLLSDERTSVETPDRAPPHR